MAPLHSRQHYDSWAMTGGVEVSGSVAIWLRCISYSFFVFKFNFGIGYFDIKFFIGIKKIFRNIFNHLVFLQKTAVFPSSSNGGKGNLNKEALVRDSKAVHEEYQQIRLTLLPRVDQYNAPLHKDVGSNLAP